MEDINNAYLRVQNMNTLLINECNKLREQKLKLKDLLSIQKKALREGTRFLAIKIYLFRILSFFKYKYMHSYCFAIKIKI